MKSETVNHNDEDGAECNPNPESEHPELWQLPSIEWLNESQRRSKLVDAGTMKVSPWSEIRRRARNDLGLDD